MNVLVLGGAGFIGRHAAAAIAARGHRVTIASRRPPRARQRLPRALARCAMRSLRLEHLTRAQDWSECLRGVDAVVNCVGILRERAGESYDAVHHRAPAALAAACSDAGVRLIHVSALGLHTAARSGFIRSKLAGERALLATQADLTIVRPSLLDGADGYAARWLRHVARWPVHPVPSDALGRIAALDVDDLGEAIARLCERSGAGQWRIVELGGLSARSMADHLAALRRAAGLGAAPVIRVPAWLTRLAAHLLDVVHLSPLSFGHVELMRRDNVPCVNRLPLLLGRAPRMVGAAPVCRLPAEAVMEVA